MEGIRHQTLCSTDSAQSENTLMALSPALTHTHTLLLSQSPLLLSLHYLASLSLSLSLSFIFFCLFSSHFSSQLPRSLCVTQFDSNMEATGGLSSVLMGSNLDVCCLEASYGPPSLRSCNPFPHILHFVCLLHPYYVMNYDSFISCFF